jgi:hypothetical protein
MDMSIEEFESLHEAVEQMHCDEDAVATSMASSKGG